MQAELNDKLRMKATINQWCSTALVVALVSMIMPFITITTSDFTETFSIYDMIATFYKSDIGLHFTFEAKGLLMSIKVISTAIILTASFGLAMLFNKNKATKDGDNSIWTMFASLFGLGLVIGYYYYMKYVINSEIQADAIVVLKAGGVSVIVCFALVFLLLLMSRMKTRTLMASILILVVIPATIIFGILFLGDRKYYIISILIIFETMLPFFMIFENRKPEARELIIIAVLVAIAVAGRAAFFMVPHFKPVVAIVIIAGICLGKESGFLVGALSGFVSNFFFGQGPWTPWQMFSFGIIGFLAGLLFKKGILQKKRIPLCIFGFFAAMIIYGVLMDTCTIFTMAFKSQTSMWAIYLSGLPLNIVHGIGTAFFLSILALPMIEKLDRIKKKYGMLE